jgi:tripartite-type tricarboxylate transporter receptor subunit TctC
MFYRATTSVLITTIVGLGLASPAFAQEYPNKAVRVIVPFAAGGNTDTIGRIVAERLQAVLGQPFLVENRTGAGGAIAAEFVAKAPADGYTLFVSSVGQIAIVPVLQKVGYNPAKDFAPISNIGTNPFVLGVHVSVPARDVKEFVAHLKANPGKLPYASGGNGSISHLSGALFVMRAAVDMIHVPYKGGAPAVADLVGGQVAMYFGNASELIQHAKSGKVRMIGVSSEKRAPQLPEVPAIAETFPGFSTITWNGLLAPAGTPAAIVERLSREVQRITKEPAVIERLQKIGVDPLGSSATEFAKTIDSDIALYKGIVQDAKIRVD